MKKKALALAVASALIAPSAFAATDTSGMRYTSASEGFYGSIRARYVTSKAKNSGANIENSSSRIGVSGTSDLGGGLTGFYTWELGTDIADGGDVSVRVGNVGLRGDFGEISAGSFWAFDYGATYAASDQANVFSGNFVYDANREGRATKSVQYTTPDFNGFQSALLFSFNNDTDTTDDADAGNYNLTDPSTKKDENDLDSWNLSGQYAVQGFTLGAAYNVRPDGLSKNTFSPDTAPTGRTDVQVATDPGVISGTVTDAKSWSIRGSYGQDNWVFNSWYGQDNTSDRGILGSVGNVTNTAATLVATAASGTGLNVIPVETPEALAIRQTAANVAAAAKRASATTKAEDTTIIGLHAGVSVDKVNLYAVYEAKENANKQEDVVTTLGVQYNLGARSRTWLEYAAADFDSNPDKEDFISIGLRFDF